MTSLDIRIFETQVNSLVEQAMSDNLDKVYLLDWFKGTLFIKGIDHNDIIKIKDNVEQYTDMTFSKVGDEYAIDFC